MVEFCGSCGTSLPKGDLTFQRGKMFTSPDYHCPSCGEVANPPKEPEAAVDPSPESDLVFKKGEIGKE